MIEEMYKNSGSSYEIAISRMQNDDRIKKYLGFFLEDPSYNELKTAMEQNDCDSAFRAAHTLKGVCQNMAFTALGKVAEQITEELRAKDFEKAKETFPEVTSWYNKVIEEIKKVI